MGGGLQQFSVSPRPLGFGFLGFWVLGLRVLGQGLTNNEKIEEKVVKMLDFSLQDIEVEKRMTHPSYTTTRYIN